jgi:hypothetical protein
LEPAGGAPYQSSPAEEGIPEFARLYAIVEPLASPPPLFLPEATFACKDRSQCRGNL